MMRENIVNDPAEWTGWEVNIRTKQRTLIVIMMRRKYIPPMLENYDDFVIAFYGPVGKQSLLVQEQKADEEEAEPVEEEEEEEGS